MGTGTRCPLSPAAAEAQLGVPSRSRARGYLRARNRQLRRVFPHFLYFLFPFCVLLPFPGLGEQLRSPRVAGGAGTGSGGSRPRSPPLKKAWKLLFLKVFLLRELDFFFSGLFGLVGFIIIIIFLWLFKVPSKDLGEAGAGAEAAAGAGAAHAVTPPFPNPSARAEGLLLTPGWLLVNPRNCFA